MPRTLLLIHGAFSNPGHFAGWARLFGDAGFDCRVPALPDHDPEDTRRVAGCTMETYLAHLRSEVEELPEPPVLIGHSMGGLLAQQLASVGPCAALVCVASAPPWMLTAQARALPHLLPLMPRILGGRAFRPPDRSLRALALHDLSEAERAALAPSFVHESGKAYRQMILGAARLPGRRFRGPVLCVSGGEDRIISRRTSKRIARRYRAQHVIFPERGHWLIAESARDAVAGRILRWLAELFPEG